MGEVGGNRTEWKRGEEEPEDSPDGVARCSGGEHCIARTEASLQLPGSGVAIPGRQGELARYSALLRFQIVWYLTWQPGQRVPHGVPHLPHGGPPAPARLQVVLGDYCSTD